jgi:DNA-binding MurR/RpiR family transcriptional regulator
MGAIQNKNISALTLKLQTLKSSLSNSEKKVIDYVLEHPEEVIYLSVSGLAEKSDVSDATVVRACRKVGMNGYQDLKVTLAQDIVTPLQSIHEEINEDDTVSQITKKVFQSTMHTLEYTCDALQSDSMEKAVEIIENTKRINIFGLGNSHSIALDLQHKLMRLGMDAVAFTDSHMQMIAAVNTKKTDCVFAISHSGSSKDIVDAVKAAKENGAKVVSITNIGKSPLSDASDVQLTTMSRESKYHIVALASRVAQMTIIDTIYTIIALRKKESAIESFRKIEKGLESKKY